MQRNHGVRRCGRGRGRVGEAHVEALSFCSSLCWLFFAHHGAKDREKRRKEEHRAGKVHTHLKRCFPPSLSASENMRKKNKNSLPLTVSRTMFHGQKRQEFTLWYTYFLCIFGDGGALL